MESGSQTAHRHADRIFSEAIDLVRFPLAVLVVAIHWVGSLQVSGRLPAPGQGSVYPAIVQLRMLMSCAVPSFFVISGYLFFRTAEAVPSFTSGVYKDKLKRRIFTLLIPFVVWNIITMLTKSVYLPDPSGGNLCIYAANLWSFVYEQNWHLFWDARDLDGVQYPILVPLWYIRDLMIVILLSPVFYILLRYRGSKVWALVRSVLFLGAVVLAGGCGWWPFAHGASVGAVFWFGIGAALAMQKGEIAITRLSMVGPLLLIGGVAALCFLQTCPKDAVWYCARYAVRTVLVTGVFATAVLVIRRTGWRFARDFSAATMFIYCWHDVALIGAQSILSRVMEKCGAFAWCHAQSPAVLLYMVLPPVVEAVVGVYAYKLLAKHLPRPVRVAIGTR